MVQNRITGYNLGHDNTNEKHAQYKGVLFKEINETFCSFYPLMGSIAQMCKKGNNHAGTKLWDTIRNART